MKIIAAILATASLVVGSLAASTFYYPRLADISADEQLTLSAPAGLGEATPEGKRTSLLEANTQLTQKHIDTLREAGVTRVRIKEITSKWPEWTLFLVALLGFSAATVIMRRQRAEPPDDSADVAFGEVLPPGQALEQLARGLVNLWARVEEETDERARLTLILRGVEELHRDFIEPFVEGRERLIQKLGMSRFAQVMDRFAVCERRLNRAWSAAADHVFPEALVCLEEAQTVLAELREFEDWSTV